MIALFLWAFGTSFALTFALLNWLAWRRTLRLNLLLQTLCVDAFVLRHCQIWVPWSEMTGIRFEIHPRWKERQP